MSIIKNQKPPTMEDKEDAVRIFFLSFKELTLSTRKMIGGLTNCFP